MLSTLQVTPMERLDIRQFVILDHRAEGKHFLQGDLTLDGQMIHEQTRQICPLSQDHDWILR